MGDIYQVSSNLSFHNPHPKHPSYSSFLLKVSLKWKQILSSPSPAPSRVSTPMNTHSPYLQLNTSSSVAPPYPSLFMHTSLTPLQLKDGDPKVLKYLLDQQLLLEACLKRSSVNAPYTRDLNMHRSKSTTSRTSERLVISLWHPPVCLTYMISSLLNDIHH